MYSQTKPIVSILETSFKNKPQIFRDIIKSSLGEILEVLEKHLDAPVSIENLTYAKCEIWEYFMDKGHVDTMLRAFNCFAIFGMVETTEEIWIILQKQRAAVSTLNGMRDTYLKQLGISPENCALFFNHRATLKDLFLKEPQVFFEFLDFFI